MMRILRLIPALFILFSSGFANAGAGKTLTIADVFTLDSGETGETVTYYVSLPDGYSASHAEYPVIFVLDGDFNLSHLVGSHEVLVRTGYMPPAIIVGIVSEDRTYHFAPTASEQYPNAGGAEKFTRFLKRELIPALSQRYRTNGHKTLIGHSFGGLFASYSLVNHPELFDSYIIVAPALWWDEEVMLGQLQRANPESFINKRLFFGIGEDDGYGMKQEMRRFIEAMPAVQGLSIEQSQFTNEGHMSAPLLTTYFGLKHIFSDMMLSEEIGKNFTANAFLQHEKQMRETYGAEAKQSAETYVYLALELMEQERYTDAAVVFERNAQAYNTFANSWYWLGQAYEKDGRLTDALSSYEKAVELASQGRGTLATFNDSVKRVRQAITKNAEP